MRLRVSPEAETDLFDAALWYEGEREQLGERFLQAVHATLERIELQPLQFPSVTPTVRRALIPRFPFGIFFSCDSDDATVLAILHLHRDPAVWQRR